MGERRWESSLNRCRSPTKDGTVTWKPAQYEVALDEAVLDRDIDGE